MSSTHDHAHGDVGHSHGPAVRLDPPARSVLQRGLAELASLAEGLAFAPTVSERFPLPLARAVYGNTPDPRRVLADVARRATDDPVAALEPALVLLELVQTNRPDTAAAVPDDGAFLSECFRSKRLNGWIATLGDADRGELEAAVAARWKFKFVPGAGPRTGLYVLLNLLARYGFVYGRVPAGDSHQLGHFIEDFTPGVVICRGRMTELEMTLVLAAMKLGVPAVVPTGFPFPLGRRVVADALEEIVESVAAFPNIRRLLTFPDIPAMPDYLAPESIEEAIEPAAVWGRTDDSFYVLRKGVVAAPGPRVVGPPGEAMGVLLTVEGEPLDAFDHRYIQGRAARTLSMIPGVRASGEPGRLVVELAAPSAQAAGRIAETLAAAVSHEFPRLKRVAAEVIFDRARLAELAPIVRTELEQRQRQIAAATEENVDQFIACIGCSPFAPDHVCILTPQRPPQCGRPYEMIKTGALYCYDDMSDIHHRQVHSGINSFSTCAKGELLDAAAGEWSGVNEAAERLTGGRTRRVQLHALGDAPHTGCGCFQLIMFRLRPPAAGIGVMERGYQGVSPDGRSWRDLHYELGGKQAPGVAGAAPGYLRSGKFLAGEGGWASVVWVSPKVAALMGDALPPGVAVGEQVD